MHAVSGLQQTTSSGHVRHGDRTLQSVASADTCGERVACYHRAVTAIMRCGTGGSSTGAGVQQAVEMAIGGDQAARRTRGAGVFWRARRGVTRGG